MYEADARSEVDIKLTSPLQPFIQYVTVQNKELQTKVAVKRQGQRKGKGQKEEIKVSNHTHTHTDTLATFFPSYCSVRILSASHARTSG